MDEKITNRIANKIFEARKEKRLTQRQVADALGLTEGQYAHYEKGRASPDINTIYQMCIFFNASFDEWLGLSKPDTKKSPVPAEAETGNIYKFLPFTREQREQDVRDTLSTLGLLREDKELSDSQIKIAAYALAILTAALGEDMDVDEKAG